MNFLPGPMELVLILIIVAMLFGVGKLPEVFGAVGKGIREFRKEAGDEVSTAKPTTVVTETPAVPAAPASTQVVTTMAPIEGVDNTVKAP